MGECSMDALQVDFDRTLKLEFHGSRGTSDAGLLAYRELDEALGLTEMGSEMPEDWRTGPNVLHIMTAARDETAAGRGDDGDGLPGPATDARMQAILSNIMAGRRPDAPLPEPGRCMLIARIAIESSKRPTMVVGRRLPGKSRVSPDFPDRSVNYDIVRYRSTPKTKAFLMIQDRKSGESHG